MKYLALALVLAALYFGWKKFGPSTAQPSEPASADTTPGANMNNRIDHLSGTVPDP